MIAARIVAASRYLRLAPFDVSTEAGRAQERYRRVALSAAATATAKVVSVLTALISLPLTLHYLGAERFGMWATISSLIAMLAFADFGIGNGVLTAVAQAHGRDDRDAVRRAVSTGFWLLGAVALGLVALFALAYPWVSWHAVFNVQTELARAEAGPALAVFVVCFAANIPLGIVQRVQMGLQQGFVASLWQCAGSLMALTGVLTVIHAGGPLPWLVGAMAGAPLAGALLNSAVFYCRQRPDLRPTWTSFSRVSMSQIARTGALFFVLQIVVAVAYASDSLVIAQTLGAAAVAQYAVPEKLFGLIALAVAMMTAPLWPAYGEAISRKDFRWARTALTRSLLVAFSLSLLLAVPLVVFGQSLVGYWIGDAVQVPTSLLLAFGIWKVCEACGGCFAAFLNGASVVREQLIFSVATAVVAIVLKFQLVAAVGVAGVVWASILAYVLFALLPAAFFIRYMLLPKWQLSRT